MTAPAGTMPGRVRALRRDQAGRPVPWFVDDQAGRNHRAPSSDKRIVALRDGICWVCGQNLPTGSRTRQQKPVPVTFVVGATSVINRLATDPPSHGSCAVYALEACPFMTRPDVGGMALWSTPGFTIDKPRFGAFGAVLLRMDAAPTAVSWWTEGRLANRDEAVRFLAAALLRLQDECKYDPDPEGAYAVLNRQLQDAVRFLPDE